MKRITIVLLVVVFSLVLVSCADQTNANAMVYQTETTQQTYAETTQEPETTEIVYITETGTKYHRAGCQYLKDSSIEISLDDAKSKGYTRCSKCQPPR